jgi:choline dehydrogenase-like flavoprotein
MEIEHDVIIIGSGVAGALIAWKLAEAGCRVLILEAGADHEKDRAFFVETFAKLPNALRTPSRPYTRFPDDNQKDAPSPDAGPGGGDFQAAKPELYYQQQSPDGRFFKSQYQRLVGGSTWAWRGNCPRFTPNDMKLYSVYGKGADWPISYADIEPWFCDAEDALGVAGDHGEWDNYLGAYRSRPFPMGKIAQSVGDLELINRLQGKTVVGGDLSAELMIYGIPQARNSTSYDGRPACHGNSTCIPICPIQAKYDATVHVKKALAAGAELRDKAVVTELVAGEDGCIRAVVFKSWDGVTHRLPARVFILAAHGIETPKILLASNERQGIANSSGKVGRYLMDHPGGEGAGIMPFEVFPFRGPQSTSGVDSFRNHDRRGDYASFKLTIGNDGWGRTKHPYDTLTELTGGTQAKPSPTFLYGQALRDKLRGTITRQLRIAYAMEQLPDESNRVELHDTTDELGIPKPKITYSVDDYVFKGAAETQKVIHNIFDLLGVAASEREFTNLAQFGYSGSAHIMGTTKMGDDPRSSVVDAQCRAHDHRNLFIVGGSVFPTGAAANPTLMTAALALRSVDSIKTAISSAA